MASVEDVGIRLSEIVKLIPKFIGYSIFTLVVLMGTWYIAIYLFHRDFLQNNLVTTAIFCFILSVFWLLISVVEKICWKMDYDKALMLNLRLLDNVFLFGCYWAICNLGGCVAVGYLIEYYVSIAVCGKHMKIFSIVDFIAFGTALHMSQLVFAFLRLCFLILRHKVRHRNNETRN